MVSLNGGVFRTNGPGIVSLGNDHELVGPIFPGLRHWTRSQAKNGMTLEAHEVPCMLV